MARIETLWHEDFRQNLTFYGYNETSNPLDFYTGSSAQIYLCPEPEDLYYMPVKAANNDRIVDFSDDHVKAKQLFRVLMDELAQNGTMKQVTWTYHPYYWRAKTSSGINLRPGRLGGRPEQPKAVTLNDDLVHGVIGGRTGSGKSVLLNNLLVTMMDEYAPWELSLYIVDMKKVEFGAFMSKGQEAAHVRACAATSEVRYVVSMLRLLERRMQMRQNFFTAIGYKKVAEFRVDNPDLALPRILVVVDEFQQLLLNAVPSEESELLRLISSITRLGRATGVHLLFASQDMSGTGIGSLLSNFKLRMALPCDAAISSSILGNNAASELEKGYVLVNCAGGDIDQNMRFQVPFVDKPKEDSDEKASVQVGREKVPPTLENDYLQGHLQYVRRRARKAGFLQDYTQKFYQEDLQYDMGVFEQTILPSILPRRQKMNKSEKYLETLALGNGVLYNTGTVDLETLCIEQGKNQNIFVVASDAEDLVYLQKLMVDNLATSPHTTVNGGNGISVDYFSFDPVLTSYYDLPKDPVLKNAAIAVRTKDDNQIPELICELHLRKILYRSPAEPTASLADFFARMSDRLIKAIEGSQLKDRSKKIPTYEIDALTLIRNNLLKEIEEKKTPEDILAFCQKRKLEVSDVPGNDPPAAITTTTTYTRQKPIPKLNLGAQYGANAVAAVKQTSTTGKSSPESTSNGSAAVSGPENGKPETTEEVPTSPVLQTAEKSAPTKCLSDLDPDEKNRARFALSLLLDILKHYALTKQGESLQKQFPLKVVIMSNINLSEALTAPASKRNDIRVLHEDLLPFGPTYRTLFMYFSAEADNRELRLAFNYFFACGNRQKDYEYCRMHYTNKMPGSIVVDCRIQSKNYDRSFKKFRWITAEPEAESLDLTGLYNLFGEESAEDESEPVLDDEKSLNTPLPPTLKNEREPESDMLFFL